MNARILIFVKDFLLRGKKRRKKRNKKGKKEGK